MNAISRVVTYFRVKSRTGETLVCSIISDVMRTSNSPVLSFLPAAPYTIRHHIEDVFGLGT